MPQFIKKLLERFAFRRAAPQDSGNAAQLLEPHTPIAAPRPIPAYRVAAPCRLGASGAVVYHGATGRIAAFADTAEKAITLCDTLNLACGSPPSRKLLAVLYQDADTVAPEDEQPG